MIELAWFVLISMLLQLVAWIMSKLLRITFDRAMIYMLTAFVAQFIYYRI